jgi:hypothetical protein
VKRTFVFNVEMGAMLNQQETSIASAARVAEYEQEVQALYQRLLALGQAGGLPSLSDEIRQNYDTALDDLAALQLQLYLCHQSLLTNRQWAVGGDCRSK